MTAADDSLPASGYGERRWRSALNVLASEAAWVLYACETIRLAPLNTEESERLALAVERLEVAHKALVALV
jgi:hypothetical protein